MADDGIQGLDLQFGPDWAKSDYTPNTRYADAPGGRSEHRGRGRDDRRGGRGRDDRGPRERRARRDDRPPRDPRPPRGGPGASGPGDRPPRSDERRDGPPPPRRDSRPPREPRPPQTAFEADVDFYPNPPYAKRIASQIKAAGRAFSLFKVARIFLQKPESYLIEIRVPGTKRLWQNRSTKQVFFSRGAAADAAFQAALPQRYEKRETTEEPPKGNWQSVVRCREGGVIIGPVNHHAHHERLREVWQNRFARMSYERFTAQLETTSDQEVIDAWLNESSVKTSWVRLQRAPGAPSPEASEEPAQDAAPEGATGDEPPPADASEAPTADEEVFTSLAQVRADFDENLADNEVVEAASVKVPGNVLLENSDSSLQQALREAWTAEDRFPIRLANRFRGHFRRAGLTIIKSKNNVTYANLAAPLPLDPKNATPAVGAIFTHLTNTKVATRKSLLGDLFSSGAATEATEAPAFTREELVGDVVLMIQHGYLIETSDGHLHVASTFVRGGRKSAETPTAGPHDKSTPAAE